MQYYLQMDLFMTSHSADPDTKFSNLHVDINAVSTSPLNATPVAEHYPITELCVGVVFLLLVVLIGIVAIYQPIWSVPETGRYWIVRILTVVSFIWIVISIYGYYAAKKVGFCVREQDITLFKGLIFRKQITQPICRIQHIEVQRGPLDRKVGLANLHVFSAGDITQTFVIPGLVNDDAVAMRANILAHKELQHHG